MYHVAAPLHARTRLGQHPYEEYDEGKVPTRDNLTGWRDYGLSKYPAKCQETGVLPELVRTSII